MSQRKALGNEARRLLGLVQWYCQSQKLAEVSWSDREAAHRANFPLKYLAVARAQLVDAKALVVTEGRSKATYALPAVTHTH